MTDFVVLLLVVLVAFLAIQLTRLRAKVVSLSDRLTEMERRAGQSAPAIPPNDAPLREPLPQVPIAPRRVPPIASKPPPPEPLPTRAPIDWEQFMGVKMFAWLGGLALFLGVVFLVKYSFENSLITPLGRVLIGLVVGLVLLATGWWLARGRYRTTAQSLCATGIVILYANIFAAHSFYQLISLTTAFFAMSAVTLGSFLLAVNLSAQVVVILGLLGGFLTPVLLPSRSDNAPVLFLYIALLDLGVAAVAFRKCWFYLVLLGALGTVFTQVGWAIQFFNASKGGEVF